MLDMLESNFTIDVSDQIPNYRLISNCVVKSEKGKQIKEALLELPIQLFSIEQDQKNHFPQKKTLTPMCNISLNSSQYFRCYDCNIKQDCFICQPCFINANHQHHRFEIVDSLGSGYTCICGNPNSIKKEAFCKNHTNVKYEIDIKEEEIKKFIIFFEDLFKLYLTVMNVGGDIKRALENQLIDYLLKINTQSLYYNKLTHLLLVTQSEDSQNSSLLQQIFKLSYNIDQKIFHLFIKISSIKQFRYSLIKTISEQANKNISMLDSWVGNCLYSRIQDVEIIDQLAYKHDLIVYPSQEFNDSYIKLLLSLLNLPETPINFWKCLIKKGLRKSDCDNMRVVVQKLIMMFKGRPQMKEYIGIIIKTFIQNQEVVSDNQKTISIQLYFNQTIQNISYKKLVESCQIQKDVANNFLNKMTQKIIQYPNSNQNSGLKRMIISSIFQNEKQSSQQTIKNIWKCLYYYQVIDGKQEIKSKINKFQESQENNYYILIQNLNNINNITNQIQSLIQMVVDQYSNLNVTTYLNLSKQFNQKKQTNKIKYLQLKLTQQPSIHHLDLNQLITRKVGESINVWEFLKANTNYNTKNKKYIYVGQKIYDIRYMICHGLINSITYNQNIKINENQGKIIKYLFCDQFIKQFIDIFNYFRTLQNYFKIQNVEFNYQLSKQQLEQLMTKTLKNILYSLILLNIVYENKNQKIGQLIKILKQNALNDSNGIIQNFDPLYTQFKKYSQTFKKLKKLLQVQQKNQQQNKQDVFSTLTGEKKKQFLEIKKKKFQQLKSKMKKIKFEEQDSQLLKKQSMNDVCLLCHYGTTEDHQLYCLGFIVNNFAVSKILKSSKQQINIKVCPHYVHKDCFTKQYGNLKYFSCPLCQSLYNCVLPKYYERLKKQENIEWQSRIEMIMSLERSKNLNKFGTQSNQKLFNQLGSVFKFFLQYLIFSKSLKCFITQNTQQIIRLRTDFIINQLLTNIYRLADQQNKEKYNNEIKEVSNELLLDESVEENVKVDLKLFVFKLIVDQIRNADNKSEQSNLQRINYCKSQLTNFINKNKKFNFNDLKKIMENFPKLNNSKEIKEIITQLDKNLQTKKLFQDSNMIELPKTAEQFLYHRSLNCKKCNSFGKKIWQCLICKGDKKCENCQQMKTHIKKQHLGDCVVIDFMNAELTVVILGKQMSKTQLYANELGVQWEMSQSPKGYTLNVSDQIKSKIYCCLNNEIPENSSDITYLIEEMNEDIQ